MIDERAKAIADDACEGTAPVEDDIAYLLEFDATSAEAEYAVSRAFEIGMRACNGRGRVYAQIGVDETACPENCAFCSFAAANVDPATYDPNLVEVPIERIAHYARLFDEEGADLISLMATAGLPFERFVEMLRAVRSAVSDSARIMANVGDITLQQAKELKQAGAFAAYHALRLGEGVLTDVEPATRLRSMRNIRQAGLALMTGVEPVWAGVNRTELANRICSIPDLDPFCIGACSLTHVDGLAVGGKRPAPTEFVRYVGALVRLACGDSVPAGGIGGIVWVDAGCDPRNRGFGSADAELRAKISAARDTLAQRGFSR